MMTKDMHDTKKEIILFTIVVVALSIIICFISYQSSNTNLSILTVFTPSLVALILTAKTEGKTGIYDLFIRQTFRKSNLKWFLISLVGIPILASLAMLTSMDFDISRFQLRTTQLVPQFIIILLIAIGEEYGWRGFLLPRLIKKFSVFNSSLILGLIWGLWHYPAYLIGTGVPLEMNFGIFMLWVILGTLFISWIYHNTHNVLTSIIIHISANAAFNYLFILPEFTGSMYTFWYFILYLSVMLMIIYYLWRKDLMSEY